jgi:hypothetical protein
MLEEGRMSNIKIQMSNGGFKIEPIGIGIEELIGLGIGDGIDATRFAYWFFMVSFSKDFVRYRLRLRKQK